MSQIYSDHARIDARSLALHRLVAQKIAENPELLEIARDNIRRWQSANHPPSVALDEWADVLNGRVEEIAALLVDTSERATRLRQSTPFPGVLTQDERKAIYESYSARTYSMEVDDN